jgi:hypothetical protein
MATTASISDSFNDGTAASIWSPFGVVSESGGCLVLNSTAGTTNYAGYETPSIYDFTGSYVLSQLLNAGNQALTSFQIKPCEIKIDASNTLAFYINQNKLVVEKQVATVFTVIANTLTYAAATHKWFRLRESSGTTFADYSTDGVTWTNYTSLANPFAMTALSVEMSAGTFNSEASGTTGIIDNFNEPPILGQFRHVVVGDGMSVSGVAN